MQLSDYDLLLLSEPRYLEQKKYWLDRLSGELTRTGLLPDVNRNQQGQGKVEFLVPEELEAKISKMTKKMDMSMYLLLLTSLKIVTYLYTGDEDVMILSPVYKLNRTRQTLNQCVVIRNRVAGEMTCREYLLAVREVALEAYDNQDFPLSKILEALDPPQKVDRLFGLLCLFNNIHDEVELVPISDETGFNPFQSQIVLSCQSDCDALKVNLTYNCALYTDATIRRFGEHVLRILQQIVENPQSQISDLWLMSGEEEQQILTHFNNTETDYPKHLTIHQLFAEQVLKTPDKPAVSRDNQELTYRELNARANRLAHVLRQKGVQPDRIVGIITERSLEMVIGILGILKAGGAYLPIDPRYPLERIQFMLEDSGSRLLLTDGSLPEIDGFAGEMIHLCDPEVFRTDEAFVGRETEEIGVSSTARDLAYIMYTSGSTGRPKGVMVEHQNVVRLVKENRFVHLRDDDRILQTGALVFDACTFEIWGALLNGLTLYLVDENVILDAYRLEDTLKKHQITILWLTSPLFNQLAAQNPVMFATLRNLLVGGDILSPKHINLVRNHYPHLQIINGYGPTENTTFSVCFSIDQEYEDNIPIGTPISNSTAYIVDRRNRLCPVGVPGELCVGGDGIARGYVNHPELTAEKFVPDPFFEGGKMYRTGDQARWLPDGKIEFIGRIDQQLKIRGFRIEPGEIENQLLGYDGVQEAIVLAKEDANGSKTLCAYLVAQEKLTVDGLREYLSRRLPEHMIPSYFIQIDCIPLTPNGKVDRNALPGPDGSIATGVEYVPPRDEIEERLAQVWAEVLGAERVGIHDNFFSLGGDSIKAIQIASRLNKYGLKMEIKDLFQYHKISELSSLIRTIQITADQGIVTGEVNLTPVQHWFFEQNFADMHHFNHSVLLYSLEGFDEQAIQKAFTKIVEHHDALRMVFKCCGRIEQYNCGMESKLFDFNVITLEDETNASAQIEEQANQIQSGIDLEKGPLVRLGLFKTPTGDHLLVVIHHLVVDGISWRILFEDLADAYQQVRAGEEIKLPAKTHSFKEWSAKLTEVAGSNEMKRFLDYWVKQLEVAVKPLPKDQEIKQRKLKDSKVIPMLLEEEWTEKLLKTVNLAYNTEINDILLTALGLAFKEWAGDERVLINLEGHGREEIMKGVDITRTVGWFTSQYPMILDVSHAPDLPYLIKSIKEDFRRIPDKGISYGILRYLTNIEESVRHKLIVHPEISFNYLGQFDQDLNTGVFQPSNMPTGSAMSKELESKYVFDINGMIVNGRLVLKFSYNMYEYTAGTVQRLVDSYSKHLKRIIEHCSEQEDTEVTPTDLGDSTLTLEELDSIAELFEDE